MNDPKDIMARVDDGASLDWTGMHIVTRIAPGHVLARLTKERPAELLVIDESGHNVYHPLAFICDYIGLGEGLVVYYLGPNAPGFAGWWTAGLALKSPGARRWS
jgi:hypothetical protein